MDDTRRIRVLKQNETSHMLELDSMLDLCQQDKATLSEIPFDEYAISPGVLHWCDLYMTLIDSKQRDNPTWYSSDFSITNYEQLCGPQKAINSGLIYSIEVQKSTKGLKPEENFGKFAVVVRPKADLSFVQCLPLSKENNNNFFSFIGFGRVMAQYGGRFLVFDRHANFLGEVEFNLPSNISLARFQREFKLEMFCEQKEYFVFEGPLIVEKPP